MEFQLNSITIKNTCSTVWGKKHRPWKIKSHHLKNGCTGGGSEFHGKISNLKEKYCTLHTCGRAYSKYTERNGLKKERQNTIWPHLKTSVVLG